MPESEDALAHADRDLYGDWQATDRAQAAQAIADATAFVAAAKEAVRT